jgi:hypothetical protein
VVLLGAVLVMKLLFVTLVVAVHARSHIVGTLASRRRALEVGRVAHAWRRAGRETVELRLQARRGRTIEVRRLRTGTGNWAGILEQTHELGHVVVDTRASLGRLLLLNVRRGSRGAWRRVLRLLLLLLLLDHLLGV